MAYKPVKKYHVFQRDIQRMNEQGCIIDTRKSQIYRLTYNQTGYFCVVQNRYNQLTGVIYDGNYINKWCFKYLSEALKKFEEIKAMPDMVCEHFNRLTFSN